MNSGKTTKDRKKSITNFLQHFSRSTRWDTSCFKKKKKKKRESQPYAHLADSIPFHKSRHFSFNLQAQTTSRRPKRTPHVQIKAVLIAKSHDRRVFKSKLTQSKGSHSPSSLWQNDVQAVWWWFETRKTTIEGQNYISSFLSILLLFPYAIQLGARSPSSLLAVILYDNHWICKLASYRVRVKGLGL